MSAFESTKLISITIADLGPVMEDVKTHFESQEYEVTAEKTLSGGWDISLRKGNTFKAVLGLRTALKVNMEPSGSNTFVKAGIGIWGQQALPTALTLLVFWPVLITQIWGMVKNAKLDDEAINVIEASLRRHAGVTEVPPAPHPESAKTASVTGHFCTQCGAQLPDMPMKFCPHCGTKLAT
jgi:hypothetical protein